MTPQPTQLDPTLVNLAKAIRHVESGGNFQAAGKSDEYGAYQFTEPTWNGAAAKFGVNVPLRQATPQQQNEVAYKQLAEWKSQHPEWNVGNFASAWNAGPGKPNAYMENHVGTNSYGVSYDTPKYATSVATAYQQFKAESGGQTQDTPNPFNVPTAEASTGMPQPAQPQGGPAFPYSPGDSGMTAGLKAAGNLPGSALEFGKGTLQSLNPLHTADTIGQIGSGFSELAKSEGMGGAIWDIIKGLPKATYETMVPHGVRQLIEGNVEGAAQSFTNDPFGQAAPLVLAAEGGAKLADRYAGGNAMAADSIVKNGGTFNVAPGGQVTNPGTYSGAFDTAVSKIGGKGAGVIASPFTLGAKAVRPIISGLTSLDSSTITAILSDPASFNKTAREAINRPSIAEDFATALDQLSNDRAETGALYENIRNTPQPVAVPENFIGSVLEKYGLKLDENNLVKADTNSLTRNKADINAIQNFVDNWGSKGTLTANEFLNMRGDIADISKFDQAKSTAATTIGKDMYAEANRTIRPQINGLKELDAKSAPQIELYKKARKDFLNPDGTFKDGAMNKIANAKGLGKEKLLSRMEQIRPGITKSLQVLKAVEDIEKANGIKVGSYVHSIVTGAGIVGGLTGNIPLVISAILTHPAVAVQILRGFGYTGAAVIPILRVLNTLVNSTPAKVASFNQSDKEAK